MPGPSRRTLLRTVLASTVPTAAGCLGGFPGDSATPDDDPTPTAQTAAGGGQPTGSPTPSPTATRTPTATPSLLSSDAQSYLWNAREFDGTVVDERGSERVTVKNGGGMRGLAFVDPAIQVSAGTTVVWEWTGRGGEHDVVAKDESFESELVESSTKTFEHTFEEPGETLYVCSEHEDKGMKGVVVVTG